MAKNNDKTEIRITDDDMKAIFGPDYASFESTIIPNCFCSTCTLGQNKSVTIVDYDIFLNDLNDIILRGSCAICKGPVGRYVETGEVEEYEGRIKGVRGKMSGVEVKIE